MNNNGKRIQNINEKLGNEIENGNANRNGNEIESVGNEREMKKIET